MKSYLFASPFRRIVLGNERKSFAASESTMQNSIRFLLKRLHMTGTHFEIGIEMLTACPFADTCSFEASLKGVSCRVRTAPFESFKSIFGTNTRINTSLKFKIKNKK